MGMCKKCEVVYPATKMISGYCMDCLPTIKDIKIDSKDIERIKRVDEQEKLEKIKIQESGDKIDKLSTESTQKYRKKDNKSMPKFIIILIGAIIGLAIVRTYFFDIKESAAWLFFRSISIENFMNLTTSDINKLFLSSAFLKSIIGMVLGAISSVMLINKCLKEFKNNSID